VLILSIYAMTGLSAGIVGQLLLKAGDPAGFRPVLLHCDHHLSRLAANRFDSSLGARPGRRWRACGTLGGFLSAWPLGKLSDRVDRRLAIIRAAVTAAATLFIMVMMVPKEASEWVLYLCVAIFGGTIIPTYGVVMAHVNDTVGEGDFVAASGGLLIVQGAGAVAGPIIAGSAMSLFARGEAYTLITAQVLIAAFGVYRLTRGAAPPAMHKGTFVVEPPVPVATTLESSDS
jgi:MFS family permease